MKNESMEQLNALKSCHFSPGAIWSEQQVMSMRNTCTAIYYVKKNLVKY